MPIEPGASYVFDLDRTQCRIVTRFKSNTPLAVVEELPVPLPPGPALTTGASQRPSVRGRGLFVFGASSVFLAKSAALPRIRPAPEPSRVDVDRRGDHPGDPTGGPRAFRRSRMDSAATGACRFFRKAVPSARFGRAPAGDGFGKSYEGRARHSKSR